MENEHLKLYMQQILTEYGLCGEHFTETPRRAAKFLHDRFRPVKDSYLSEMLNPRFASDSDEMVIFGPVEAFGMCPHHLLPIIYEAWVAYVPGDEIIGLSKIPRLIHEVVRVPCVQEDITPKIVKELEAVLSPRGVIAFLRGEHLCMRMRGVKSGMTRVTSSSVSGVFRDAKEEARSEFFAVVNSVKGV